MPQGSVLGPLLFILYINDLPNNIKNSIILTFADDTKLIHPIRSSADTYSLQSDLDNTINWSINNNMKLNKDKFDLITHKQNKKSSTTDLFEELPFSSFYNNYSTGDSIIHPISCVKDLGVLINNNLTWEDHITKLCSVGKKLSGWILNVFFSRNQSIMITLFNSLVRSRLEYCCQIWNPYKINQINSLENIQRSFTHKIKTVQHLNYWERLSKLDIMSLQRRREQQILLFVWRIKNNRVPNDIDFQFSKSTLRSGEKAIIKPMPKAHGKLLSMYENSFSVSSAKLWNKLPQKLANIDSFNVFQKKLTEYLKMYPDKPPVSGYYHLNSNSLLDYPSVTI